MNPMIYHSIQNQQLELMQLVDYLLSSQNAQSQLTPV